MEFDTNISIRTNQTMVSECDILLTNTEDIYAANLRASFYTHVDVYHS